ncbi:uncharacterized protein LOC107142580 [Marmota marmota marmota]|uniref:uncharacterized protein LOC107142580 n=1 Tax=Marmota marmota marmota TaxID=9994 RepID=UPI002093E7D1|nr:uncharacterized protein LOC107142580 [Marmota marmota marmota]
MGEECPPPASQAEQCSALSPSLRCSAASLVSWESEMKHCSSGREKLFCSHHPGSGVGQLSTIQKDEPGHQQRQTRFQPLAVCSAGPSRPDAGTAISPDTAQTAGKVGSWKNCILASVLLGTFKFTSDENSAQTEFSKERERELLTHTREIQGYSHFRHGWIQRPT